MSAGVVVALALARPAALPAQDRLLYLPLDSATVVRLGLTDGRRITGRLVRPFGPDSTRFVYCPGERRWCPADDAGAIRVTPASDVTRVETRRGSRASRGAALGAVADRLMVRVASQRDAMRQLRRGCGDIPVVELPDLAGPLTPASCGVLADALGAP